MHCLQSALLWHEAWSVEHSTQHIGNSCTGSCNCCSERITYTPDGMHVCRMQQAVQADVQWALGLGPWPLGWITTLADIDSACAGRLLLRRVCQAASRRCCCSSGCLPGPAAAADRPRGEHAIRNTLSSSSRSLTVRGRERVRSFEEASWLFPTAELGSGTAAPAWCQLRE